MPATVPVFYGVAETVAIAPLHETFVTVGKGEEGKINVAWNPTARYMSAPVAKGAGVGQLAITEDGKQIDAVPVVTQASVQRAGFFKRVADHFRWVK
jgi:D-alanyl-D-alanine carboxypeptidase (penicillin-binding protein 5/6)